MLKLVTSASEIKSAQHEFAQRLLAILPARRRRKIGHQGGGWTAQVASNEDLWYATRTFPAGHPTCYQNVFGWLGSAQPYDIVAEIDFPLQGVNRRMAGVLAKEDKTHALVVLHRGGIGGAHKGVGKEAFLAWYRSQPERELAEVDEGAGKTAACILVGGLHDASLLLGIFALVRDVYAFKQSQSRDARQLWLGDAWKGM